MSNPYQTPAFDPKHFQDAPSYIPTDTSGYSAVNQVRLVAILNGVQGALEIPMGLLTISMGVFIPALIQWEQARNPNAGRGGPPQEMIWMMTVMYIGLGIPTLAGGIMRVVAAFRNFHFRGRVLGIVSVILGMASVLSCYCAPTALGMAVFGLIVFLNPAVKAAFEMGSQGRASADILAAFGPFRPPYPPPQWAQPPPPPGSGVGGSQ
jgi:hypothetical protein